MSLDLVDADIQWRWRDSCTREEFCRMLLQTLELRTGKSGETLLAEGTPVSFRDCDGEAVRVCAALGIVNGLGDGNFGPGRFITRRQAAVMLARAAEYLGFVPNGGAAISFADADTFADWAADGIGTVSAILCGEDRIPLMQGKSGGRFAPQDLYTVEQAAATMVRLASYDGPSGEGAAPPAGAEAFSWADLSFAGRPFLPQCSVTREELDSLLGEPLQVERAAAVQDTVFWETREYDGVRVTCEEWDGEFYLGAMEYRRGDVSCVRDVRVGDSLRHVLATFRNEAPEDAVPKMTDAGFGVVLYGTPMHMQDYGILLFRGEELYELMYQSRGAGIRLSLDGSGTVAAIEIFGGLH